MEDRIYGEKIDIDTNSTANFYNERAQKMKDLKQEYTTVLLGDQNPDYALKWDKFEKNFIMPKLHLDISKNVLDLGCGIGRWADSICDKCNVYYGVDFSSDMVAVARERHIEANCSFFNMSVADAVKSQEIRKIKYDIIIITGVSMYINDAILDEIYANLVDCLNVGGIIYIEESVGKKERLTLNHIWSENLQSHYCSYQSSLTL